jgi:gentisate 1,2-dioxygenase
LKFLQIRGVEGLPDGGPRPEERHTYPRFIDYIAEIPKTSTETRQAFHRKLEADNLSGLWNVPGGLITPQPKSARRPFLWHFNSIRAYMMEAGTLVTANGAERRVLILEHPGLRRPSKITTSVYAGIQLIMPGEVAPAHRQ